MPIFGQSSKSKLYTCENKLIRVAEIAIQFFDFSIVYGYRDEQEQMKAYNSGNSKAKWLESPHNYIPSFAFDAVPYYKESPHWRYGGYNKILNYCTIDITSLNRRRKLRELIKIQNKEIASFYIMSTIILMIGKQIGIDLVCGGDWDQDFDLMDQAFDDIGHIELKGWKDTI